MVCICYKAFALEYRGLYRIHTYYILHTIYIHTCTCTYPSHDYHMTYLPTLSHDLPAQPAAKWLLSKENPFCSGEFILESVAEGTVVMKNHTQGWSCGLVTVNDAKNIFVMVNSNYDVYSYTIYTLR